MRETTNYMGFNGQLVVGRDPADDDVHEYVDADRFFMDMPCDSAHWMPLGVAPRPYTRWGWVRFDYHHGRLMRFPLPAVLRFCLLRFIAWNKPSSRFRRGE